MKVPARLPSLSRQRRLRAALAVGLTLSTGVAQTQAPPATVTLLSLGQPGPDGSLLTLTVQRGQTAYSLARAAGITVEALLKLNGLSSAELKVGQLIKVPATPTTRALLAGASGGAAVGAPGMSTVRAAPTAPSRPPSSASVQVAAPAPAASETVKLLVSDLISAAQFSGTPLTPVPVPSPAQNGTAQSGSAPSLPLTAVMTEPVLSGAAAPETPISGVSPLAPPVTAAPSPAPGSPALNGARPTTIEVRPGDTLYSLARRYGVGVAELAAVNALDPGGSGLEVGAVLKLPPLPGAAPASAGTPPAPRELGPDAAERAALLKLPEIRQVLAQPWALRALSMLGAPYRLGGTTPAGLDCSGLVLLALPDLGLPRTSASQAQAGQAVGRNELRAGDLVFFDTTNAPVRQAPGAAAAPVRPVVISHVGLYLGEDLFISADSYLGRVALGRLGEPYWKDRYVTARRVQSL